MGLRFKGKVRTCHMSAALLSKRRASGHASMPLFLIFLVMFGGGSPGGTRPVLAEAVMQDSQPREQGGADVVARANLPSPLSPASPVSALLPHRRFLSGDLLSTISMISLTGHAGNGSSNGQQEKDGVVHLMEPALYARTGACRVGDKSPSCALLPALRDIFAFLMATLALTRGCRRSSRAFVASMDEALMRLEESVASSSASLTQIDVQNSQRDQGGTLVTGPDGSIRVAGTGTGTGNGSDGNTDSPDGGIGSAKMSTTTATTVTLDLEQIFNEKNDDGNDDASLWRLLAGGIGEEMASPSTVKSAQKSGQLLEQGHSARTITSYSTFDFATHKSGDSSTAAMTAAKVNEASSEFSLLDREGKGYLTVADLRAVSDLAGAGVTAWYDFLALEQGYQGEAWNDGEREEGDVGLEGKASTFKADFEEFSSKNAAIIGSGDGSIASGLRLSLAEFAAGAPPLPPASEMVGASFEGLTDGESKGFGKAASAFWSFEEAVNVAGRGTAARDPGPRAAIRPALDAGSSATGQQGVVAEDVEDKSLATVASAPPRATERFVVVDGGAVATLSLSDAESTTHLRLSRPNSDVHSIGSDDGNTGDDEWVIASGDGVVFGGARVGELEPGAPAYDAGLRHGDIITGVSSLVIGDSPAWLRHEGERVTLENEETAVSDEAKVDLSSLANADTNEDFGDGFAIGPETAISSATDARNVFRSHRRSTKHSEMIASEDIRGVTTGSRYASRLASHPTSGTAEGPPPSPPMFVVRVESLWADDDEKMLGLSSPSEFARGEQISPELGGKDSDRDQNDTRGRRDRGSDQGGNRVDHGQGVIGYSSSRELEDQDGTLDPVEQTFRVASYGDDGITDGGVYYSSSADGKGDDDLVAAIARDLEIAVHDALSIGSRHEDREQRLRNMHDFDGGSLEGDGRLEEESPTESEPGDRPVGLTVDSFDNGSARHDLSMLSADEAVAVDMALADLEEALGNDAGATAADLDEDGVDEETSQVLEAAPHVPGSHWSDEWADITVFLAVSSFLYACSAGPADSSMLRQVTALVMAILAAIVFLFDAIEGTATATQRRDYLSIVYVGVDIVCLIFVVLTLFVSEPLVKPLSNVEPGRHAVGASLAIISVIDAAAHFLVLVSQKIIAWRQWRRNRRRVLEAAGMYVSVWDALKGKVKGYFSAKMRLVKSAARRRLAAISKAVSKVRRKLSPKRLMQRVRARTRRFSKRISGGIRRINQARRKAVAKASRRIRAKFARLRRKQIEKAST